MKKIFTLKLTLLLYAPLLSHAGVYKCTNTDGSLSYQSHPCQSGGSNTNIPTPPATHRTSEVSSQFEVPRRMAQKEHPALKNPETKREPDFLTKQAEDNMRRRNAEAAAYNKTIRCDSARQQLAVARTSRPIYRLDNKGDRHYVDDANRANEIAAAERRVAAECQ